MRATSAKYCSIWEESEVYMAPRSLKPLMRRSKCLRDLASAAGRGGSGVRAQDVVARHGEDFAKERRLYGI
jgi:hypothetical protein